MADPKKPSRFFEVNLELVATCGIGLVLIACLAAGTYGWTRNIGKLMNNSCGQGNYGCLIVRGIGVPMIPVGAVAGYF